MDLPKVTSREEWLTARERLMEKEATSVRDALRAELQSLPMVEIEKGYVFEGHTYSTIARGSEHLVSTAMFLDLTPFGRQED